MSGKPPADIPPPRLFRLLLATPRPVLPVPFRFAGFPGQVSVRAISTDELNRANDEAEAIPDIQKQSYVQAGVVASALLHEGRLVFRCAQDVLDLEASLADELSRIVLGALDSICPMYGRSDRNAWHAVLCEGAKHPTNYVAARSLGHAYDIAEAGKYIRVIDRPDRHFGLPTRELLDGHWMAYSAARALLEQRYRS